MNCKPGDLAFVVGPVWARQRSTGEKKSLDCLVGKVVRCVEREDGDLGPGWVIDPPIPYSVWFGATCSVGKVVSLYDHQLRPIRDQDGEDETLLWAGLPHKETA